MDTVAFYNLLLSELAAGSIQDIIKAAADYTHQHITVLDLSYNVLAMYPKEAIGDPYWDPQFQYGYVPEYNMKKIFENKYPDATFAGVSYITWGDIVYPRCVTSLKDNGKALAHVSIYHTDPSMSREEIIDVCTCLDHILRVYFLNNNRISTANEAIMSALVSKLFLGQQITQSYLEEWARSAGTPLLGNYFVASISNEDMHSSIIEFLSTRMGHLHSCCAYAEMRKCNYILFYSIKDQRHMDNLKMRLLDFINSYKLHIGISAMFSDLNKIEMYMYQCRKALSIGRRVEPECKLHSFDKLRTEIMLSYILSSMDVANCTHPLFTKLMDEDTKNDTQYCKTLSIYLDCICDSAKAAKALFIHRNTMLYRLKHIEETYDVSFNDADFVKDLMMSAWVRSEKEKAPGICEESQP